MFKRDYSLLLKLSESLSIILKSRIKFLNPWSQAPFGVKPTRVLKFLYPALLAAPQVLKRDNVTSFLAIFSTLDLV
ncbi:hypothetical protein [Dulcicalothrix desertica]|uniref:hypothetical protein n=1 Tax=Dulcicalothrix desertica TaxID=32056 RepID=UPI000F8C36B7|nr:hypothetical protein [Dulcicalothrix desertica]